jgi:hypothetical protein
MGDQEEKEKVSKKRRRNFMSRALRDQGDHKGAFALKIVSPKKGSYKREKLNPREITIEGVDDEEIN